jgi:hypothetical protein
MFHGLPLGARFADAPTTQRELVDEIAELAEIAQAGADRAREGGD